MSKGLEALNRIAYTNGYDEDIATIETELKEKEQYWNYVEELLSGEYVMIPAKDEQKQAEILRIIKEKRVFIEELILSDNVDEYNDYVEEQGRYDEDKLTQAEFDLLREFFE